MATKIRRQRPVKGGRESLPSCVLKEIQEAVARDARQFKCSKSFVVATALADAMGIKVKERYDDEERPKLLRMVK